MIRLEFPSFNQTLQTSLSSYLCKFCELTFSSIYSLRDHMIEEQGIEPGLIPFLETSLGIDNNLDTALTGKTASSEPERAAESAKSILCKKCNKLCKGLKGLQQHFGKTHSNWKKHCLCKVCGKLFRHKYALKSHTEQVHEKSTRIRCEYCLMEVYNKYSLKKHILTHQPNLAALASIISR